MSIKNFVFFNGPIVVLCSVGHVLCGRGGQWLASVIPFLLCRMGMHVLLGGGVIRPRENEGQKKCFTLKVIKLSQAVDLRRFIYS